MCYRFCWQVKNLTAGKENHHEQSAGSINHVSADHASDAGAEKTASYWLIKKQWFDVLTIHGEMRVVISSFETWYANQTHYRKVNGPPPGEELRKKSYSVKDISNLLGIGIDTVYDLIHREKFRIPCINTVSGASMLQCFSSGIIRNAPIILSQLNTQTSCTKQTS